MSDINNLVFLFLLRGQPGLYIEGDLVIDKRSYAGPVLGAGQEEVRVGRLYCQ